MRLFAKKYDKFGAFNINVEELKAIYRAILNFGFLEKIVFRSLKEGSHFKLGYY